jgi:hypothetical protein
VAKTIILIDDDQDDLDIMEETIKSIDDQILCISFIYPEEAIRVVSKELISMSQFRGMRGQIIHFKNHTAWKITKRSLLKL